MLPQPAGLFKHMQNVFCTCEVAWRDSDVPDGWLCKGDDWRVIWAFALLVFQSSQLTFQGIYLSSSISDPLPQFWVWWWRSYPLPCEGPQSLSEASQCPSGDWSPPLFISWNEGYTEDIRQSTISWWLAEVISAAYVSSGSNLAGVVPKPHEVLAEAPSLAFARSMILHDVMEAAYWRFPGTFIQFYLRDMSRLWEDGSCGVAFAVVAQQAVSQCKVSLSLKRGSFCTCVCIHHLLSTQVAAAHFALLPAVQLLFLYKAGVANCCRL